PMHAFDLAKLKGGIEVRLAKQDESLLLLDGQDVTLQDDMLVIADAEKPVALAGIMGGGNSEIDENTQDILLEAAYFSPLVIAGKARALGLHTDSSHRFERGVDSMLQAKAIERATALLLEIVGGEAGPVFEQVDAENMPPIETIALRPERIRRLLGLGVSDATIKQHLIDLQMDVNDAQTPWQVKRPSWRFDVTGEHDLVEEIGRLEGLDKIEPIMPKLRAKPYTELESTIAPYRLKTWLAGQAYREIVSYSFIAPEDQAAVLGGRLEANKLINLANPIASNMAQMRLSILPGLLSAARSNEQRQHQRIRLFESGNVFSANTDSDTGADEASKLALLAGGENNTAYWAGHGRKVGYFDVKGDLDNLFDRVGLTARIEYQADSEISMLHPGQAANILLDGKSIGCIGTLHPQVQQHFDLDQAYVVAEICLSALQSKKIATFKSLSKFPESTRDLALVAQNQVSSSKILKEIQENAGKLLKSCELFDIYRGKNIEDDSRSLAFSLVFQSDSESLGSEFIDELIAKVLAALKAKYGVSLRS
ncbi:MAG: phenylalanine--tRNA ligase subunit beta, partial [Arenicellales bacterium]